MSEPKTSDLLELIKQQGETNARLLDRLESLQRSSDDRYALDRAEREAKEAHELGIRDLDVARTRQRKIQEAELARGPIPLSVFRRIESTATRSVFDVTVQRMSDGVERVTKLEAYAYDAAHENVQAIFRSHVRESLTPLQIARFFELAASEEVSISVWQETFGRVLGASLEQHRIKIASDLYHQILAADLRAIVGVAWSRLRATRAILLPDEAAERRAAEALALEAEATERARARANPVLP